MDELTPKAEKKPKAVVLCGHVNRHYIPAQGVKKAEMTCTRPVGHEGDHSAKYQTLYLGEIVEQLAFWSDAAG